MPAMHENRNRTLHLKRFEAAETARKVASLETIIRDLDSMVASLSAHIAAEEQRTKVTDARRADYSMAAIAAAARKSKLITSLVDLRSRLEVAKREHDDVAIKVRNLELARGAPSENANLAHVEHDAIVRR